MLHDQVADDQGVEGNGDDVANGEELSGAVVEVVDEVKWMETEVWDWCHSHC